MNKRDLQQLIRECISEVTNGNIEPHRNSVDNMLKGFTYMLDELDILSDYNKLTDREKASFISGMKGYIDHFFSDKSDAPRH
jgi:hypothetical protein